MVGHLVAVEQAAHDLDRFRHPLLANTRRVECGADRGVLGVGVAGADAELEPSVGDVVDRGGLAGEVNGVPEVVVEHERTDPDPFRRGRHRRQRRERRPVWTDVVERAEHVEAGALGGDGDRPQVVGAVVAADLETEPEGTISARHPPIFAAPVPSGSAAGLAVPASVAVTARVAIAAAVAVRVAMAGAVARGVVIGRGDGGVVVPSSAIVSSWSRSCRTMSGRRC